MHEITTFHEDGELVDVVVFGVSAVGGYALCTKRLREPRWDIHCTCERRRCSGHGYREPTLATFGCPRI